MRILNVIQFVNRRVDVEWCSPGFTDEAGSNQNHHRTTRSHGKHGTVTNRSEGCLTMITLNICTFQVNLSETQMRKKRTTYSYITFTQIASIPHLMT